MDRIDPSLSDREIGSKLSADDVEALRSMLHVARERFGMRYREIAEESGVPEYSLRNFASRKSVRPDNAILGRLYRFWRAHPHLRPEPPDDSAVTHAPIERIRSILPVSNEDVAKVFDWYCGYYLCFRRTYSPSRILVSWLHIIHEDYPLARFTQLIQYPDPIDQSPHSYVIIGLAVTRNGRIYLTGHHDAELKHIVLDEPLSRNFSYLPGLCLQTSSDDGEPFATRILCQYLGSTTDRESWKTKIGVFERAEFEALFDNADTIIRSLGEGPVLTVTDTH